MHASNLLSTRQIVEHHRLLKEPDLLSLCYFHGHVREVDISEELSHLASTPLHRSWSNKVVYDLRIPCVSGLLLPSLLADGEEEGVFFDATNEHQLVYLRKLCSGR